PRRGVPGVDAEDEVELLDRELGVARGERSLSRLERARADRLRARDQRLAELERRGIRVDGVVDALGEIGVIAVAGERLISRPVLAGPGRRRQRVEALLLRQELGEEPLGALAERGKLLLRQDRLGRRRGLRR